MTWRKAACILTLSFVGCGTGSSSPAVGTADAERTLFALQDSMVAAMVAGTGTASYITDDWQGVNLNGTPMNAAGFEGEDRVMVYDSIHILDRSIRLYGETAAAVRWHANFYVRVNGQPSFAEMRILDVFVHQDGRWLNDLTQVTPIFGTVGNPPGQGGEEEDSTGE